MFWTWAWAQQPLSFQFWASTLIAMQLLRSLITITSITISNECKLGIALSYMINLNFLCSLKKEGLIQNNVIEEKSLDFKITIFLREHNEKFPHVIWIILTGCDISAGIVLKGQWMGYTLKAIASYPLTSLRTELWQTPFITALFWFLFTEDKFLQLHYQFIRLSFQ